MARFTLPRDLYHGKGALEALKTFKGKKAIICVGGGSMKRFGFLQKAEDYLKEAGMEVKLFEGIEPDPSVETVMKGAAVMQEFEPDWIVAMGGGSPIDAAKAMWIKYEYPDITFEDMCKVFGIPALRNKAHFCAISSTSGTATEVTAFSIITDYEKGIKYPIADFEITPDVAIVDPDLAETMPQKLVAHTGMDAMTHAIEAYVSTANCDFTDPLALHAIKMIQSDLIPSYNGDMEKRDSMHNAQCLAGMAFSNALLGIVHSMAHKTGAAFADYGAHIIHREAGRHLDLAHHDPAHSAQRHGPGHHFRHSGHRRRHPYRVGPEFPRARRSAPAGQLGQHAHGREICYRGSLLAFPLSGTRHSDNCTRL